MLDDLIAALITTKATAFTSIAVFVGTLIAFINLGFTVYDRYKKCPRIDIQFPNPDLLGFTQSSTNEASDGDAIVLIRLSNKSDAPITVVSYELIDCGYIGIYDATSPEFTLADFGKDKVFFVDDGYKFLRPIFLIDPQSTVQGFLAFSGITSSVGHFKLRIITTKKVFNTMIQLKNMPRNDY